MFVHRSNDSENFKYLQLFELMDKQTRLDDDMIFKKMKNIDKVQYSNLKRHLYRQILTVLRIIQNAKNTEIEIREYLDFSDLLYAKGLYKQSLKLLEKARSIAQKIQNDFLLLEILERIKTIESKHITRSGSDIAQYLTVTTDRLSKNLSGAVRLSNFGLLMHGYYIKNGHIKNDIEKQKVISFYTNHLPDLNYNNLSVNEQFYYHQALIWYYYILLDFDNCIQEAQSLISMYAKSEYKDMHDIDAMLRAYHYLLTCLQYTYDISTYELYWHKIEEYRKSNYNKFNTNTQIISFIYVHHARLNYYILSKNFQEALKVIPSTLRRIQKYKNKLDAHRIMVFYYKIAYIYLLSGQPGTAVDYLNRIFIMKTEGLREDIQGYSYLMFLMAHYDLKNETIIPHLIHQIRTFFIKMETSNNLYKLVLNFFNQITKVGIYDRKKYFVDFKANILALRHDKIDSRALLYLDVETWVDHAQSR